MENVEIRGRKQNLFVGTVMILSVPLIRLSANCEHRMALPYTCLDRFRNSIFFRFCNFCGRRGEGRRRPARDGAVRLRALAAAAVKIEKRGRQVSKRPGVRTSKRPSVQTSERPDVRRMSERPTVENLGRRRKFALNVL